MSPRESQNPLKVLDRYNRYFSEPTQERGSKTRYECARCGNLLQLTESLLIQGCPRCGAKTFRFTTIRKKDVTPSHLVSVKGFEEDSPDIIRLVQPGVYQINLSKLTGMNNTNEPLILSAKRGIFRISFPTND